MSGNRFNWAQRTPIQTTLNRKWVPANQLTLARDRARHNFVEDPRQASLNDVNILTSSQGLSPMMLPLMHRIPAPISSAMVRLPGETTLQTRERRNARIWDSTPVGEALALVETTVVGEPIDITRDLQNIQSIGWEWDIAGGYLIAHVVMPSGQRYVAAIPTSYVRKLFNRFLPKLGGRRFAGDMKQLLSQAARVIGSPDQPVVGDIFNDIGGFFEDAVNAVGDVLTSPTFTAIGSAISAIPVIGTVVGGAMMGATAVAGAGKALAAGIRGGDAQRANQAQSAKEQDFVMGIYQQIASGAETFTNLDGNVIAVTDEMRAEARAAFPSSAGQADKRARAAEAPAREKDLMMFKEVISSISGAAPKPGDWYNGEYFGAKKEQVTAALKPFTDGRGKIDIEAAIEAIKAGAAPSATPTAIRVKDGKPKVIVSKNTRKLTTKEKAAAKSAGSARAAAEAKAAKKSDAQRAAELKARDSRKAMAARKESIAKREAAAKKEAKKKASSKSVQPVLLPDFIIVNNQRYNRG